VSIAERPDVAEVRELPHPNRDAGDRCPDQPTPEVGELLRLWVGAKLDQVDALVAEAEARTASIPDQRTLWSLVGEVIVLLRALELEVADLKAEVRSLKARLRRKRP
jgi:hypothetical protein